ncbi:tetratricopeptide repeat protein [Nitrosomonas sp.]|uniref:tetratricopeptide repeat protein n=1 Tax=Nitrosomonas sp. TaxID=42353 RepID=UPI0025D863E3|nr:tetratricopeptide repeat protein [Nitrosomonas sp.]MBV6447143.1 hypothetical protein [Nitrosomonas sp.]
MANLSAIFLTTFRIFRTICGNIRKSWDKLSHFNRNIVIGILIAGAIPLLHHIPYASDWIAQFEDNAMDSMIKANVLAKEYETLFRNDPKDKKYVFLDIDEESYTQWGEPYHVPRDKLATLIEYAKTNSAKIIVVDIDLTNAGNNPRADAELKTLLTHYPKEASPLVLIRRTKNKNNVEEPRKSFFEAQTDKDNIYWAHPTYFKDTHDQVVRRWMLLKTVCQNEVPRVIPSVQLTVDMLIHSEHKSLRQIDTLLTNTTCTEEFTWSRNSLDYRARPIELAAQGVQQRLIYSIPDPSAKRIKEARFTLIPAWLITEKDEQTPNSDELINDKIVIIGASYPDSRDLHQTPVGEMPGALVIMNAIQSLFEYGQMKEPPILIILIIEIMLILLMAWAFARFSSFRGLLVSGGTILLIILPLWLVCAQTGFATSSESNSSDRSLEQQMISNMTEGTYAWVQSRHEKALEFFQKGLEIAIFLKKKNTQIMFLNKMGIVQTTIFAIQRNPYQASKAIEFFQQSLTISREINDRKNQADNLVGLAQVYLQLNQYVPVADYYEQALVIYREINDREGEAAAQLDKLNIAYTTLGRYDKALDILHRAREIYRESGDKQLNEAINLLALASVYQKLNQLKQALDYYKEALDISQKINERNLEAMCLMHIGNLYRNQKQYQLAIDNLQSALKIHHETRDLFGQAHTLLSLGSAYDFQGQHSQALSNLQESLGIYRKIGSRSGQADVLSELAYTYYRNNQYVQALDYHQQSLEIRQTSDLRFAEERTLIDIGNIFFHQGQPRQAYDKYSQALGIGIQINTPELLWQSWHGVSKALNRLNQTHAAILAGKQAVNILQGVRFDNLKLEED